MSLKHSIRRRNRRGITAVLAMLFMVLFVTLALGFYSTVTTSVSLSRNDLKTSKALLAAESGVQFMRYHLAHVEIPPNAPTNTVLAELYNDLKADLEGTGNLGSNHVALVGNTIKIPSEANTYIVTDTTDNSGFTVTITEWAGSNIVCKVMGQTGNGSFLSSKGVRLDFKRLPIQTDAFNNAVASKGAIVMQKGAIIGVSGISADTIANIMSAKASGSALTITGGTIGGNVGVIDDALASITGGSVHGTTNIPTIYSQYLKEVAPPEFPIIDTTAFAQYATNTYTSSSGSTLQNIRIPAGTGTAAHPLKFTGGVNIQGILYIESPNFIEFRGNTKLEGFIVFENANTIANNQIDMRGNFSIGNLPAGAAFDSLRAITGVAVLAPTTALTMSGSVDSNVRGNVILGTFNNAGSADITIDTGTLMTLEPGNNSAVFNGKNVKFTATGQNNQPSAGVSYEEQYVPIGGSYQELSQ